MFGMKKLMTQIQSDKIPESFVVPCSDLEGLTVAGNYANLSGCIFEKHKFRKKKLAKKEGAEIYWGDETGVRNDCQHSLGYAPRGKTPVVEINAKRFSYEYDFCYQQSGTIAIHDI